MCKLWVKPSKFYSKEVKMWLDPRVIDEALVATECRSLDELGWKFLGKSGNTVRNYQQGKTVPPVTVLMVLKRITHRPLDEMIIEQDTIAA